MSRLKMHREKMGYSQTFLSEISGVPAKIIQEYEQGNKNINEAAAETLYCLSGFLKCEATSLLEENGKHIKHVIRHPTEEEMMIQYLELNQNGKLDEVLLNAYKMKASGMKHIGIAVYEQPNTQARDGGFKNFMTIILQIPDPLFVKHKMGNLYGRDIYLLKEMDDIKSVINFSAEAEYMVVERILGKEKAKIFDELSGDYDEFDEYLDGLKEGKDPYGLGEYLQNDKKYEEEIEFTERKLLVEYIKSTLENELEIIKKEIANYE